MVKIEGGGSSFAALYAGVGSQIFQDSALNLFSATPLLGIHPLSHNTLVLLIPLSVIQLPAPLAVGLIGSSIFSFTEGF